ncbi:Flp pilus assembly complex ATPase component TadA [Halobacillus locisalis]|uniref:Flp pilus assembly complex ATPase component TadA n=1 Tax=Halobacillus locisalis TaxID=220753 RepID=A0A838CN19_9BACI|nr:GspE/PulE family protein [Halobacillus locisalis]MBA2173440.1 Flp pilus assembly complex ATPase component TadA [Halobacillus locisalis]
MAERKRLGDILKEAGLVSEDQIKETLNVKKSDQKLGDALLERGLITEQQLIEVLEFQLGFPHVSLYRYPVDTSLLSIVSKDFASRNMVMPLKKENNELTLAMNDPMDYYTIDDLQIATGFQILPVIATKDEIIQAINKYYNLKETEQEMPDDDGEQAPAIKLMNQILQTGVQMKASDIHIDPQESKVLIRYRVDGLLRTERTVTKNMQSSLIARVKIMANLNITETRLPQDGRIKANVNSVPVDLRISSLPTVYGEKIVIRILDLGSVLNRLSELGFNKVNYQRYMKMIEQPSGMILITGPTGSGKSSTLYASLNHLNTDDQNIITIEDPVEYQIEGINQVQVNTQTGLTFTNGLRSVLRQDPDIVMVGEIRDSETAEIAVRASLTGHLVFSTLHTNGAVATIPRLIDMDIEPYLVVSSLSGIVAQRLVRRICRDCKEKKEPTEMEREVFEKRGLSISDVYYGKGCSNCQYTGYRGRLAIQEVLVMDDEIRKMMMNNQSIAQIRQYVWRNGMIFLIDDGLLKVKKGLTSIEEVMRVALDD